MSILDALSKHSMFSETLDTLNRDPSTAHQMKGFDFAQRFPSLVPGNVFTPTSFVGPTLAKGYQYGQELSRALLDGMGGFTIGDAIKKAGIESDANIEGMQGKGFNMDTYNQNLQDFNIDDVTFANSFGIPTLKNKFANIGKTISDAVISPLNAYEFDPNEIQSKINAARNREELNRIGSLALDDAGLNTAAMVDEFSQTSKPRFDVRNFLTNVKDKGLDMLGSGKELAFRGIGNLIAGPVGGFIGGAIGKMKTTPEQRLLKDFYEKETGLDSIGRIQGGIMQGYNPVSMFGPQGLTSAINKRIAKIQQTLNKQKLNRSKILEKRLADLKELREKEKQARVDATRRMAQENRAAGDRGGYQSSFGKVDDFMGGSGEAKDMGSF